MMDYLKLLQTPEMQETVEKIQKDILRDYRDDTMLSIISKVILREYSPNQKERVITVQRFEQWIKDLKNGS